MKKNIGIALIVLTLASVLPAQTTLPGTSPLTQPGDLAAQMVAGINQYLLRATAESVAAGKQIFTRNCATCHGITAEGGPGNDLIPPAPDLTDDKWDHGSTDGEVFDVIKNGVAPDFNMIPWKDKLKDPDVWNVVNYLRSIAKKK